MASRRVSRFSVLLPSCDVIPLSWVAANTRVTQGRQRERERDRKRENDRKKEKPSVRTNGQCKRG